MTLGQTLKEQYDNHDCHLSPEDGCSTCEKYFHYIKNIKGKVSAPKDYKTPETFLERIDDGSIGGSSLLWV